MHLQRGYRQSAALELAPLAEAVREGDADAALALLRGGTLAGVHFHEGLLDPLAGATRERLLQGWRDIADAASPQAALQLASRVRLLTALRDGAQGASVLNARIEEALAGAHRDRYFHGRLLLVTENSYRHGLFNGDIGVCLRDRRGRRHRRLVRRRRRRRARFPSGRVAGARRRVRDDRAQGAGLRSSMRCGCSCRDSDARTLSRELLYTAITRARDALHVCANEAVLRAALSRRATRISGLARRLQLNRFSNRVALNESLPACDPAGIAKSQCLNRALPKVAALTPDARTCTRMFPARSPQLRRMHDERHQKGSQHR